MVVERQRFAYLWSFLQGDSLKRLVQPFLPSIIEALPLQGVPPRLASASLEALGELSRVTRQSMNPWIHRLIPHMLETMQDQSSSNKQRTSMKTLGQIASSTGYVITPYVDYPQLLPTAAGMLPATKRAPWPLRREVIRTLGILGLSIPIDILLTSQSKVEALGAATSLMVKKRKRNRHLGL